MNQLLSEASNTTYHPKAQMPSKSQQISRLASRSNQTNICYNSSPINPTHQSYNPLVLKPGGSTFLIDVTVTITINGMSGYSNSQEPTGLEKSYISQI
jgi:hypothetical protein